LSLLTQAVISGILIGGLYALMSLGLSLSWGVLKVINLAHFSFILLSAYGTYELATTYGFDPFLAILICVPVFTLAGMGLQWFLERFRVAEFESLLLTFGLFIIFESLASTLWTADFRRISAEDNPYASASVWLGPLAFPVPQLSAFLLAIVIAVAVSYLLRRTYFGRAVRALAQDREVAGAFGVNHRLVSMQLAGLAAGLAALAGVFIAMSRALFPGIALEWFGIVFSVVILGGLGSTVGTFIAAVIIGLVGAIATVAAGPAMAPLATFVILIATLLFRPEGIMGSRVET
jgi:branched-chain amino acid transport system permease protein